MILSCPNCNARFLVNAAALRPAGREVRCGRCRHQWFATPDETNLPADKPVAPAETELSPSLEPSFHLEPRPIPPGSNLPVIAKPRRRPIGALVGWIAFLLVVVALGIAVAERDTIMALYPDTRDVYAAVGFSVPKAGDGLQIADVVSSRQVEEGVPVLVSQGRIVNVSKLERHVPTLRGALRDAAGRELQSWTFTVPVTQLAPGDSVPFRTEIRQPAAAASELSITFVSAD